MGCFLMSTRLETGGSLLDRSLSKEFTFNGKRLKGFKGDTLASALLANNQVLVGRSFKYHRPRGIVAAGPEEPNALFETGSGSTFEPNQRATTTKLVDGLQVKSQNHWPTLEFDIGVINSVLARFLPAGFYYKTFIHPRFAWKHIFEPIIRRAAGLGSAPTEKDSESYEHFYAHVDLLIIGGGIAGITAARAAMKSGLKVLIAEQNDYWGGRASIDNVDIENELSPDWINEQINNFSKADNIKLRLNTMAAGVYDHGYVLLHENLTDGSLGGGGLRQRLWKVRAKHIITATGAIERPLSFAGNDLPGVMLAASVRDYVMNFGVSCGDKTVIVTNNDDAYRTAIVMKNAGLEVPCIIDARTSVTGDLPAQARKLGIRIETGKGISTVKGSKKVEGVTICSQAGGGEALEEISCDCVAMSGGWSPVVHLWSHCGGKLNWDDLNCMFKPDDANPPIGANGEQFVTVAGTANGYLSIDEVLMNAHDAAIRIVKKITGRSPTIKCPKSISIKENQLVPVWFMPHGASQKLKMKTWLDFQNDVKVTDVELSAQEGFESVEHTKRYTTLGMATDQGKLSNINGLAVLSNSLNLPIPDVGTTTFRPPYHPISLGSIGGDARGDLFKPIRKTSIHKWINDNGAVWEPVADWRRPYCFIRGNENIKEAVEREILNTRNNCGILDASTLGKILVKGPDSGKFLDMIYTNLMSNLKVGKCRYGLMCSENGFLSDDGVVVKLSEDAYLCHTTSGGSDRIHAHMEEWLQTEWWDWKVYTLNLTEQYSQIAIVGPKARQVIEKMGVEGFDISPERLPFMSFSEGKIAGINARVFRISFSGELSYEISVPAGMGQEFWNSALSAGDAHNIMPYGTEALHVMRAEKGFIMIGDETDGTVIPQDLGLDWAISKKKEDFIGKRAQLRAFLQSDERWKLVGLKTVDPTTILPDGSYAVDGDLNEYGHKSMIGRVTSSYYSPTLKRSIALALVQKGSERMDEVLDFPNLDGTVTKAVICDPVFYDKEGKSQNA
jgi:sarcosine oxidase subunit alpha